MSGNAAPSGGLVANSLMASWLSSDVTAFSPLSSMNSVKFLTFFGFLLLLWSAVVEVAPPPPMLEEMLELLPELEKWSEGVSRVF